MKKLVALSVLLLAGFVSSSACNKKDSSTTPTPTPTTGTITGRVTLQAGQSGNVQNTRIAIYASFSDWQNDRVLVSVGADGNGNYSLNNLTPGTYYFDAWKDNNNNGLFDIGDFWNVYGSGSYPFYTPSPLQVAAGQSTAINLTLFII